ncbi:unnamed protein product [Rhizopus stolonifer]
MVKTPKAVPHYTFPSYWAYRSGFEWMKNHMSIYKTRQNISGIYLFQYTSSSLYSPKRPKISDKNISTLYLVAAIINLYNVRLSSENKYLVKQQVMGQASLVSSKQYPKAYSMLKQALDAKLLNLPYFLWIFTQPDDNAVHHETLAKIVQFVLTNFCSKCHRNAFYQSKYERTHWIDRVVPILQCFSGHSFQWCEVPDDERAR